MRKALLIGLIVCVLALGGIGAAFATNMNITGVGQLSSGQSQVPEVDVIDVNWSLDGNAHDPCLKRVLFYFKPMIAVDPPVLPGDVCKGQLWIDFQDASGTSIGSFEGTPCDPRVTFLQGGTEYCDPNGGWVAVDLTSGPYIDPHDVSHIKVTYAD